MARHSPPRIAESLLRRVLPDDERGASIRGDLYEEFNFCAARSTPQAARRWYWRQTLALAGRALLGRSNRGTLRRPSIGRISVMDSLTLDLKYAVRSLARARAFTAMAVTTLALGIGASTAVFSVVDAVLRRPLWFADPDRVMWMMEVTGSGARVSVSWPDYLDWRARQKSFEGIAAVRASTMNLTGSGDPERLDGRWMTWNFFDVLGVRPAIGRSFSEAEDRAGGTRVAVISDGFWRRRFNADPSVLRQSIVLDGEPHDIIGVLPAGFRYNPASNDQVFVSLGQRATDPDGLLDRGNHNGLSVVGRLRPGVTEAAARDELKAIAADLTREYPNTNADTRIELMPVTERLVGDVAPTLNTLFGAVAFLLVLGAVNVASLLVTRGVSRRHELALRSALGCGRWRLVRQFMVESLVLTIGGAAAGLGIAAWLIKVLIVLAPPDLPRLDEVHMSAPVWMFATACALVSALVLAAFPAMQSSGPGGQQSLVRADRSDGPAASAHRIRRTLMVVEVALAVVLLTGAGLMVRTVQALSAVDTGFDPSNLLTLRFDVNGEPGPDFGRRLSLMYDDMLTRLQAVPGVASVAFAQSLPIEGARWGSVFTVGDRPAPPRAQLPNAAFVPVTAGFFDTMRIPLRAGRSFDGTERDGAPEAVIVNEAFARHFWPGGTAVGQRLKQGWPDSPTPWRTIVGVVADVKLNGVDQDAPMQVFLPMRQHPVSSAALVIRAARSTESLIKPVAAVVHEASPNLPLYDVRTVDELMSNAFARQRMTMIVLGGFAGFAIVLAFVGLYGVISHGVAERTREIGVRVALGATRQQVTRLFVRQGAAMTAIGLGAGCAMAYALTGVVQKLLFEVHPNDPVSIGAAVSLLAAVAIGACYLPARRAAQVDPTTALRGE